MRTLNPSDFPVDRVMRGEFVEGMLPDDAADDLHAYRDQSLDEAEETLREEAEYWHGYTTIESEEDLFNYLMNGNA